MAYISDATLNRSIGDKVLYTRVTIMTFDFITTDEITGVVIGNPSYTNDSTSDIRRTMTIMLYPTDATFDVTVGSKVWMDKYVKVEIGVQKDFDDTIEYFNMGVFVIDNPSKTYSATENSLTLNCIDIMSRLTGIRGGVIEGITHVIPQNSNVRKTIIAILKEGRINRYVVDECEIDVPYDITVDGGSSLYDLLKELVNILPNYQIYFDVDGVFHYDKIPSGQNEPIMVNDDVWEQILIDYDTTYDFENVKNCIEVIGGAHDNPLYISTINYQRDSIWDEVCEDPSIVVESAKIRIPISVSNEEELNEFYMNLNGVKPNEYRLDNSLYKAGYICIEFPPLYEAVGKVSINGFRFVFEDFEPLVNQILMNNPIILDVTEQQPHYVYIRLSKINGYGWSRETDRWGSTTYQADYIGEYQPRATVYETNPSSPFFDSINYHCDASYSPNSASHGTIDGQPVDTLNIFVDEAWENLDDSLRTMVFQYSLSSSSDAPMDISSVMKTTDGYCKVAVYYKDGAKYILPTSEGSQLTVGKIRADLLTQGTHIARYEYGGTYSQIIMPYQPNTLGTLRIVCSGDEYDNIWSDDLAMQRAKFELYQKCRLLDTVTINVVPQYWLDTNWLVEITLPNKNGIEEKNQYLIKSITTDGGVDGSQSLTLMRYYPYYPSI